MAAVDADVGNVLEVGRRDFCRIAAACAAGLAITACGGGTSTVDGNAVDGEQPHDAHAATDGHVATDAHGATADAAPTNSCAPSPIDCGLPSAITTSAPKFFSNGNFFVCRDAGGVFALTAVCTHQGGIVAVHSGEFLCPLHGSEFTFAGAVVRGPAGSPLRHFAVCLLGNGNLGVSTGTTVSASIRLDA